MSDTAPQESNSLKDRIRAVTRFLEEFEKPDFWFARWERHNGEFQVCILHPVAEEFVATLLRDDWVIPRRWPEWRDEARSLHENPELLETLTVDAVRRILSAHFLTDRIKEGHLLRLFEEGHLQAILRRLERLAEEL